MISRVDTIAPINHGRIFDFIYLAENMSYLRFIAFQPQHINKRCIMIKRTLSLFSKCPVACQQSLQKHRFLYTMWEEKDIGLFELLHRQRSKYVRFITTMQITSYHRHLFLKHTDWTKINSFSSGKMMFPNIFTFGTLYNNYSS